MYCDDESVLTHTGFLLVILLLTRIQTIQGQSITLPEADRRNYSDCYQKDLLSSCDTNQAILVDNIYYGTKLSDGTCSLIYTDTDPESCCQLEDDDCLWETESRYFYEQCSGLQLCNSDDAIPNQLNNGKCNKTYLFVTQYLHMGFFCVEHGRIGSVCDTISVSQIDGQPYYLQNRGYPNTISSADTYCACSIESDACNTTISVSGTCDQSITINSTDDESSLQCTDNNGYTLSTRTINASYITVTFENSAPSNDGKFWLGFHSEDKLFIDCPPRSQQYCLQTTTQTTTTSTSTSSSTVTQKLSSTTYTTTTSIVSTTPAMSTSTTTPMASTSTTSLTSSTTDPTSSSTTTIDMQITSTASSTATTSNPTTKPISTSTQAMTVITSTPTTKISPRNSTNSTKASTTTTTSTTNNPTTSITTSTSTESTTTSNPTMPYSTTISTTSNTPTSIITTSISTTSSSTSTPTSSTLTYTTTSATTNTPTTTITTNTPSTSSQTSSTTSSTTMTPTTKTTNTPSTTTQTSSTTSSTTMTPPTITTNTPSTSTQTSSTTSSTTMTPTTITTSTPSTPTQTSSTTSSTTMTPTTITTNSPSTPTQTSSTTGSTTVTPSMTSTTYTTTSTDTITTSTSSNAQTSLTTTKTTTTQTTTVLTSTLTSTTTPTTTISTTTNRSISVNASFPASLPSTEDNDSTINGYIVAGAIGSVLVIFIVIIIPVLCCCVRPKIKGTIKPSIHIPDGLPTNASEPEREDVTGDRRRGRSRGPKVTGDKLGDRDSLIVPRSNRKFRIVEKNGDIGVKKSSNKRRDGLSNGVSTGKNRHKRKKYMEEDESKNLEKTDQTPSEYELSQLYLRKEKGRHKYKTENVVKTAVNNTNNSNVNRSIIEDSTSAAIENNVRTSHIINAVELHKTLDITSVPENSDEYKDVYPSMFEVSSHETSFDLSSDDNIGRDALRVNHIWIGYDLEAIANYGENVGSSEV